MEMMVGDKDIKGVQTLEEANKAKEGYFTHQSTWMLVRGKDKVKEIEKIVGALPVRLNVRYFGEQSEIIVYTSSKISEIKEKVAKMVSADLPTLRMKLINEDKIMKFEGSGTLKDLEVVDRTSILVEIKDAETEEAVEGPSEEENHLEKNKGEDPSPAVENIDDTPNLRSCIVNSEEKEQTFERFHVDIFTMTIKSLTEYLTREMKLKAPRRLRNLTTKKLYVREEEDKVLNEFEQFQEGGARLQIETGRYAT